MLKKIIKFLNEPIYSFKPFKPFCSHDILLPVKEDNGNITFDCDICKKERVRISKTK